MKKALFVLSAALILFSGMDAYATDYKDFLPMIREKLGKKDYQGKDGDIAVIKDVKFPEQKFGHIMSGRVNGKAVATSSRLKGWWNTAKTVNFEHQTDLVLSEKIISTEGELNRGIIRSEYLVTKFNEHLITAKMDYDFNGISTKSIIPIIHEIAKKNGKQLDDLSEFFFTVGGPMILLPDPTGATQIVGTVLVGVGGIVKCIKLSFDFIHNHTGEDYIPLDKKDFERHCPDYESFVTKVSRLDGTRAVATWQCGKGYTEIKMKNPKKSDKALDDDMELLAKLIYRTNPIATDKIYPKEEGEVRMVDASEIGGMIFTNTVDYDTVDGIITVVNTGRTNDLEENELADIKAQTDLSAVKFEKIQIVDNGSNVINLQAQNPDKNATGIESISLRFTPHGKFYLVKKKDKGKKMQSFPEFIRKVELTGEIQDKVNNFKGILQEISCDEHDLKININYEQVFLGIRPHKTNR